MHTVRNGWNVARYGAFALLSLLAAGPLVACGADPKRSEVGHARMSVTSKNAEGVSFRLRDAIFDVTGPEEVTVLSETYPHTEGVLTVPLRPGTYDVSLRAGAYIEFSNDGAEAVWATADSELTSSNPTTAEVRSQETTNVVFSFIVEGATVAFGGDLTIGIGVSTVASRCPWYLEETTGAECESLFGFSPLDAYGCREREDILPSNVCDGDYAYMPLTLQNRLFVTPAEPVYLCGIFGPGSEGAGVRLDEQAIHCAEGFHYAPALSRLVADSVMNVCYFACVPDGMPPETDLGRYVDPCFAPNFELMGTIPDVREHCCVRQ